MKIFFLFLCLMALQHSFAQKKTCNYELNFPIEMVQRGEALTANGSAVAGLDRNGNLITTGEGVDNKWGGGVNNPSAGSSSYSVIVMNSTANVGDFRSGGCYTIRRSSPGELLAHETLGHGVGGAGGSSTWGHQDAKQMTNLYLRTQGVSIYRNGRTHGSGVVLSKTTATAIPTFIQVPLALQMKIDLKEPFEIEPVKNDNTNVAPSYLGR